MEWAACMHTACINDFYDESNSKRKVNTMTTTTNNMDSRLTEVPRRAPPATATSTSRARPTQPRRARRDAAATAARSRPRAANSRNRTRFASLQSRAIRSRSPKPPAVTARVSRPAAGRPSDSAPLSQHLAILDANSSSAPIRGAFLCPQRRSMHNSARLS